MRPPLVVPRPHEGDGGDALSQGDLLGVERHVDPPEGPVAAHAVLLGRREAAGQIQ